MRIVNLTVNATEATYPQRIVIDVIWDQPIYTLTVENLIFEVENAPGVTITGYNSAPNVTTPYAVFLGQTLIAKENIFLTDPYTVRMSFTVSPFMEGTLRVSRQPWNKPLTLRATTVNGAEGDWSTFLSPSAFSSVVCKAYYSKVDPTATESLSFTQPLQGQPRLKNQWSYSDPLSQMKRYTGLNIKISNTNDFTEKPIVPWDGGNFWWWEAAGCRYSTNAGDPPYGNYYSESNASICYGPPGYVWGGYGGRIISSTQMPIYSGYFDHETITNAFGSKLATNTRGGFANEDFNWATQPYLGTNPTTFGDGKNSGIGRMEGWVLANPAQGDPLKDMPSTWNNRYANSTNGFCLAPWRLAERTDPVPMLIQVYYQVNWLYSTIAPVN